jgi:hypothetical protein
VIAAVSCGHRDKDDVSLSAFAASITDGPSMLIKSASFRF